MCGLNTLYLKPIRSRLARNDLEDYGYPRGAFNRTLQRALHDISTRLYNETLRHWIPSERFKVRFDCTILTMVPT